MIRTLANFQAAELAALVAEYPDAEKSECRELAYGPTRRAMWVDEITAGLVAGLPTCHSTWRAILRELGKDYIYRRVFHDHPDIVEKYVEAGFTVGPL